MNFTRCEDFKYWIRLIITDQELKEWLAVRLYIDELEKNYVSAYKSNGEFACWLEGKEKNKEYKRWLSFSLFFLFFVLFGFHLFACTLALPLLLPFISAFKIRLPLSRPCILASLTEFPDDALHEPQKFRKALRGNPVAISAKSFT